MGSFPSFLFRPLLHPREAGADRGRTTSCRVDEILVPLLASERVRSTSGLPGEWFRAKTRMRGGSHHADGRVGYPSGGFPVLIRALLKEIENCGGTFHFGCTATEISRRENGYRVDCVLEDCAAASIDADVVISTVSARRFAEMAAGLSMSRDYLDRLRSVRYEGHLSLVLRLKQPLSDYYRTLVPPRFPFRVVTEHTRLVGLHRYGGHIVYLSRDIETSDPLWTQPDGDVFRLFYRGLTEIHPELARSDIKDWRLTRTRYARPVSHPDGARLPLPMETPMPGLFMAGIAQSSTAEGSLDGSVRLGLTAAGRASRILTFRTEGTAKVPGFQKSEVV